MKFRYFILFFLVIACSENPFGDNDISSCDHSPNVLVGLPVTCSVVLGEFSDLLMWIDANDSGTFIGSFEQVSQIIDKSGSSHEISIVSGVEARRRTGIVNGRNVLEFSDNSGTYSENSFSGIAAAGDFSVFLTVRIQELVDDAITFSSDGDFSVRVLSSGMLEIQIGSGASFQTGPVQVNETLKIAFLYSSSSSNLSVFINEVLIETQSVNPSINSWGSVSVGGKSLGQILEVLLYASFKSVENREAIYDYLNKKWGF